MQALSTILEQNSYPGRGIAVGRSPDGEAMMLLYFIMGRSENSRNRIFVPTEDGIRTQAHDESKLVDPSLIIYHPVRRVGGTTIVTNGDQTDTIATALQAGESYLDALRRRCFEPDGPIFTPRISAVLDAQGSFAMSILKAGDAEGSFSARYFYEYEQAAAGTVRFIHTYQSNAPTPPSFSGEPVLAAIGENCPKALAEQIWNALDADNKISLFVRRVPLSGDAAEDILINRYQSA